MLLYLTNSLIVGENDPSSNDIKKAVRNLAIACCESKHYLMGDGEAVNHFCELFKSANDDVSKLFDNMRQNYSTLVVPEAVAVYWEVVNSNPSVRKVRGKEIIQLDFREFLDTRSVQETVLVGEDIEYDCWFYRYILDWYLNQMNIKAYCAFKDRHGGGGRMAKVLLGCFTDKETSLCFVDTDKKYPEQPLDPNSTCKKCMRVKSGPRNLVKELNVQEIENLLPLGYVDLLKYEGKNGDRKAMFDALRNQLNSEHVLQFFDLKCGLKKYEKYMGIVEFIEFCKKVCGLNPQIMNGKSFDEYYASKEKEEELYPGLMQRVLRSTIEIIKTSTLNPPILMGFQENEWKSIGRLMLSFGFARRPEGITN